VVSNDNSYLGSVYLKYKTGNQPLFPSRKSLGKYLKQPKTTSLNIISNLSFLYKIPGFRHHVIFAADKRSKIKT
jgi:hypothetical protein